MTTRSPIHYSHHSEYEKETKEPKGDQETYNYDNNFPKTYVPCLCKIDRGSSRCEYSSAVCDRMSCSNDVRGSHGALDYSSRVCDEASVGRRQIYLRLIDFEKRAVLSCRWSWVLCFKNSPMLEDRADLES